VAACRTRLQKRRAILQSNLTDRSVPNTVCGWVWFWPDITNMRSREISINAALRTADVHIICAAIDAALRKSPNLLRLAEDAGVDRTHLYRTFRIGQIGPRLDLTIKILSAMGLRFIVKFVRQPKSRPNHFARSREADVHIELRSNSRLVAGYLTRAFETAEIGTIVAAFSDVLRAQENVAGLAEKTIVTRPSLYRAFRAPHVPRLKTVVSFLKALGLRLAVKPLPNRVGN
jgi:probable addiction module antidote protein